MNEESKGLNRQRVRTLNSGYDRDTVAVMDRVLRPDSCCVDVGAHQGSMLKPMLERTPRGICFAVEALPHLARRLREHFPRARVLETAVADYTGRAKFQFVTNAPGYSGLQRRLYDRPDPQIVEVDVAVSRLDDIIPADARIDLVKIDIEGGEYHALLGAGDLVARCRPVIVFEGGARSTGQYGVTPEMLFGLIADRFGMRLSTMRRWLDALPPYDLQSFVDNWGNGPEFYFIAYH